MSIINRMLQELDRRHAAEGPPTVPGTASGKMASTVRTVKPARTGSTTFWRISALVILVAAAGVAYLTWHAPARRSISPVTPPSSASKGPALPRAEGIAAAPVLTAPAAPAAPPSGTSAAQATQGEALPQAKVDMLRLATEIETPIVEPPPSPPPRAAAPRSSVDRETVRAKPPAAPKASAAPGPAAPQVSPQVSPPAAQPPAPPKPAPSLHALRAGPTATDPGRIDKRVSRSSRDRAEGEFRRAMNFVNQGRMSEGMDGLRAALALDPTYDAARQTLVSLLLEAKRTDDAAAALEEGLALNSSNSGFAMLLARIRVERGNLGGALELLQKHEAAALDNGEYRAFVAALLQRLNRHEEAIQEYLAALTIAPGVGTWWVGLGISQEASNRRTEAAESFRRAKLTGTLNTNLAAYADQRLRQLQ